MEPPESSEFEVAAELGWVGAPRTKGLFVTTVRLPPRLPNTGAASLEGASEVQSLFAFCTARRGNVLEQCT